MSKTKKLISVILTLLMVLNIFSVVVFAEDDLADYSSLTDYIEKNVPVNNNAGIYSAESYATLSTALNAIDYQLPAAQQSTVDGYLSDVQTAVAGLVADESQAVAQFSLTGTSDPLHPQDTVTVTFGLNTNYAIISAGAVIIFDSTKFELVGGTTINDSVVDHTSGILSNYTLTGSVTNTAKIFAQRNSNTAYWNTNEMKAQYTALNIGFALNSKISDPVVANGTVATMTFRVLDDVQFGTQGAIFISSDFNKTSSFAGGLNYAARSVGQKMGPTSSCIAVGQTLNMSAAQLTLSVDHTVANDAAVEASCTQPGYTAGSHCSVCNEVLSAQEVIPALGHNYVAVVTEPNCTEGGYTTYTCSRCADSYVANETEATGHTDAEWVVVNPATCTAKGLKTKTCPVCSTVFASEEIAIIPHTPGEAAVETIDGVEKSVVRCTSCGEIISVSDLGLADYTALNAAIAAANAIDPVTVYNATTYATLMDYVSNVDTTLNSAHQSEVDTYTATINGYLNGLTVADQLRLVNGTATIEGTTITLTPNPEQTQINMYPSLKNSDQITFSNTDGPRVSKGGVCYSTVNGTVTITLVDGRQFTVYFAMKDPALDVADYSAVDAALARAATIKEEDVYDAATYATLETAVNAVVRGLHEKDQSTVTGYARAISGAYDKIALVQKLIRTSGNATVTKNGDTIIIERKTGSDKNYITIYNTLSNGTDVVFERTGKMVAVSDGIRYSISQNTSAKILLENGKEYNVLYVITPLERTGLDGLAELTAKANGLDPDEYYDFSKVSSLVDEIDEKELDAEEDADLINYYVTAIEDEIDLLKTVVSLLVLQNGYASKDGDTITVRVIPGQTVLGIYNYLKNGDSIDIFDVEGLTLHKSKIRYYTLTEGTAKITLGGDRTYNVIMTTEFVKEFRPELVLLKYVDGTYKYDSDKQIFSTSTTEGIARIYKDAKSAQLSVNVSDYGFITETSTFYQINSSALAYADRGVATFVVHADDGTDVTVKVTFKNIAAKKIIEIVPFNNSTSVELDGSVITVTLDRSIQVKKDYISVPRTVAGEPVIITSDNAYVQTYDTIYALRSPAAGADITLTFDGVDYTINYIYIPA